MVCARSLVLTFSLLLAASESAFSAARDPAESAVAAALQKLLRKPVSVELDAYSPCRELFLQDVDFSVTLPNPGVDDSVPRLPTTVCHGTPAEQRAAWEPTLRALKSAVDYSLARKSPFDEDSAPTGSTFTTGYDYHSNVHAQWARLSLARAIGEPALLEEAKRDLPRKRLQKEARLLLAADSSEFDYARVWFALLLNEYARDEAPAVRRELLALKEKMLGQTLGHLRTLRRVTPKQYYPEFFNGWHDDPALLVSIASLARPEQKNAATLKDLAQSYGPFLDENRRDGAFFSHDAFRSFVLGKKTPSRGPVLPEIQHEVARSLLGAYAVDVEDNAASPGLLPAAHAVAQALSARWPLATDPARCDEWLATVNDILSRPDYWKTSFLHSHFLPQFLWLGLARQRGELQ